MQIKKALTFRASSIGDCLMGKYFLENVHAAFPDAKLGIVVANRGAMIHDLFRAYPWLEVLEVNRHNPRSVFSLWKNFYGSDLVVTQYAGKKGGKFSFASKLVAWLLVKRGGLVGFVDASHWNSFLYDELLPVHADKAVVEHDREALRVAGIPITFPFPEIRFIRDGTTLTKFKLEKDKFILVHLFAGNTMRGLSPEKKRELLLALSAKCTDTRLVISGGVSDREEAVRISKNIPAVLIAGETTLQELMNLISESHGVVSVDTGVAHLAVQIGKPLVLATTCLGRNWWFSGQYGDMAPITMFSRSDLCVAGHVYKEYPDCMNKIDMNEVVARVAAVLTQ